MEQDGHSLDQAEYWRQLRKLTPQLLKTHGIRPKRRLGQNFLVDGSAAAAIVEAAELQPSDCVLEIGAGLGALTVPLAGGSARVVAVELDRRLADVLAAQTRPLRNVCVVQGDFLRLPIDELAPGANGQRWKVVANLPYYVTTPILERLYAHRERFERFVLTVQQEVARRLVARPGSKDYGSLTAFTQYHVQVQAIRTLPPGAFLPRPKVSSTVLRMLTRLRPLVEVLDEELFFRIVRAAFAHRRKNVLNSVARAIGLAYDKSAVREAIQEAGISPQVRGETLGLDQFARIANNLAQARGDV